MTDLFGRKIPVSPLSDLLIPSLEVTDNESEACLKSPTILHMSHVMRKQTMWFLNRTDTNRAVQAKKIARDWEFWI